MQRVRSALLRPARGVGIALLLVGLALHLAASESGMPWRHAWWDLLQRLAPREAQGLPGAGALAPVIVAIDDETTRALGTWPWPRDVLANLVGLLDRHGAAALALGVGLEGADPFSPPRLAARFRSHDAAGAADALAELPDTDELLLAALGRLPAALPVAGIPDVPDGMRGRGCAFPRPAVRAAGPLPALEAVYHAAVPPLAGLVAGRPHLSGTGLGAVGIRAARGLVLREVEAVQQICGEPILLLGIEALRLARGTGDAVIRPTLTGLAVFLGNPDDPETLRFPVERDGSFWLRSSPIDDTAADPRYVPAAGLFRPDFDRARVAGRVVLLAVTGTGDVGEHRSPLGRLVSAAETQAQIIEQILAGDFLRRPWFMAWAETALMLVGCTLVIAFVPAARPERAVVLIAAGVAAVMGLGFGAFLAGLLVDAAAPAVGMTVVAAGVLTATLVERDRARLLSEVALAGERADRAELAGELGAAARMQSLLLPERHFRLPSRLDLAAHVEPARLVGGDFYDHFMLDDRHLLFLVADVSGKGAEASQFMLLSKTLLKSVALRTGPDLGLILRRANAEILRENPATMFVTVFAGLLDVATGDLAYASAGHDAPLLFGAGPPAPLPIDASPPLGITLDLAHPVSRCRLAPGDRLCLFSDGVSEAMNAAGHVFGRDRLRDALSDMPLQAGCVGVVTRLLGRISAFTGDAEQSDDLTLMVLTVAPEASPAAPNRRA